jgi:hypothetical protein
MASSRVGLRFFENREKRCGFDILCSINNSRFFVKQVTIVRSQVLMASSTTIDFNVIDEAIFANPFSCIEILLYRKTAQNTRKFFAMLRQAMMYLWQQIFGAFSSIIKVFFISVVVFTPQIKNKYLANPGRANLKKLQFLQQNFGAYSSIIRAFFRAGVVFTPQRANLFCLQNLVMYAS